MKLQSVFQRTIAFCLSWPVLSHSGHHMHVRSEQAPISDPTASVNGVPYSVRAYWMRQANLALDHPYPYAAFGTVIVNHTGPSERGELVCTGRNSASETGNPTLHGEMAAIANCTTILTSPSGPHNLTPAAALDAFAALSLYTNAESCPMCAAAARWAGLRELVYGTSVDFLVARGWAQIRILSREVFQHSLDLPGATAARLLGGVLANETDLFFAWQNDLEAPCPRGHDRQLYSTQAFQAFK
ncbi:cytosine deaminase [Hypoxylon sp. NC1633]|nr:cytosine deaminase [Hypoxylon sp. NC1633]